MNFLSRLSLTRFLLLLVGVPLFSLLVISTVASRQTQSASLPELHNSFDTVLGNALPYKRVARKFRMSVDESELRVGASSTRSALARNPLDPQMWEALAGYESALAGGVGQAAVLRGWLTAIPHSPKASWALANLLIREGRIDEAFPLLKRAAADDPNLRPALFQMAWKLLDDPERIVAELVPDDLQARLHYFSFLVDQNNRLAEAEPAWRAIVNQKSEFTVRTGMHYAERLAGAGMGLEAARVWDDIFPDSSEPPNGDRIVNGGFEASLYNAGLGWLLTPGSGYQFTLDNFEVDTGSRSLKINFDGTTNLDFLAVRQWVLVEPNTEYEFTASTRTENLTTDSGIYFSLSNVSRDSKDIREYSTEPLTGTLPWTRQRLTVHTGPRTRVLLLLVRRLPSRKLNNLIGGTIWIDSVSLIPRR